MPTELTEAQARELAEVRTKRAELAASREARQPKPDPVAEELRLLVIEQKLDELEQAHGPIGRKICAVYAPDGSLIVCKKPHAANYKKLMDREKLTIEALNTLCKPCLLFPPAAEYDALVDEWPGIIGTLATQLTKLAGSHSEEK